jgi:hypothetical protein
MLKGMLQTLGLNEGDLFFDQQRLKKELFWEPAIQQALEECEVFIFLISPNSVISDYCRNRELATAARRRIPIETVLLTPTPFWHDHDVPGAAGIKLGAYHSGGLPKDLSGNTSALTDAHWQTRDHALEAVAKGLEPILRQTLFGVGESPSSGNRAVLLDQLRPPPSRPRQIQQNNQAETADYVPQRRVDLVPYYCDQIHVSDAIDEGLLHWQMADQALVLLVKGVLDDGIDQLYRRLRADHLAEYVGSLKRELAQLDTFELVDSQGKKGEELIAFAAAGLYPALGMKRIDALKAPRPLDTRALEAKLRDEPYVLNLQASLLTNSVKSPGESIHALLKYLERCTIPGILGRLTLVVFVEDPNLVACANLKAEWKLTRFSRVHVVETKAPRLIGKADVIKWHRDRKLEQTWSLSQTELLARLPQLDSREFRLREFAEQVQPLLRG